MQHDIISNALRSIAQKEGITEAEVKKEIALAISCAIKSDDPEIRKFWKNMPFSGDEPTIEEIIDYIIMDLFKQNH